MLNKTLDECIGCVPSGWTRLMYKLYTDLNAFPFKIEVIQIKPKFGGLRFYYLIPGKHDEKLVEQAKLLIDQAERYSYKICEFCGGEATTMTAGWMITCCEFCKQKHEENRKNR